MSWTVVIPVKSAPAAKSRLGRGAAVARAIALDTIAAAVGTGERIVVVTADREIASEAAGLGATVLTESEPAGLDAAIARGLVSIRPGDGRAVLLGDLPALGSAELTRALRRASRHARAYVPDAEGTGTTLVTARAGSPFRHAFGPGSAGRHRAGGLVRLRFPPTSPLRRDVDLESHLGELAAALGPRTREALRRGTGRDGSGH